MRFYSAFGPFRFSTAALSIFLTVVTPSSAYASGVFNCISALLNRRGEVQTYDFRAALTKKGLNPDLFTFEPVKTTFNLSNGLSIWIQYDGKSAGVFSMVYNPSKNNFESHPHVERDFKGRGLGLLLYVIGAKIAREKYGANLRSSWRPSDEAKIIWEWIVQNGWGSRNLWGRARFNVHVVDNNFGDAYLYFLRRSTQALPDKNQLH